MTFSHLIGGCLRPKEDPAFPRLAALVPVGALPPSAFPVLSGPQYQRAASSCLPHAVCGALESDVRARVGADLQLCRLDAYYGARVLAGDWPSDVGSYPDKMAEWLRSYGTVTEDLAPYDPAVVTTWKPSPTWAADRRLLSAVLDPLPADVDQIRAELAAGRCVVVCHLVDAQMTGEAGTTGVEKGMTGPSLGGHARCFAGYDDGRAAFLCWNWWAGWGVKHPTDARFKDSFSWVPYAVAVSPTWGFFWQRISRGLDVR